MKIMLSFLFLFMFAGFARSADIPVPSQPSGEYLLAASFPSDTDYVCFVPNIGEKACTDARLVVEGGSFPVASKRYGAPAGVSSVAAKTIKATDGTRIGTRFGNAGGEISGTDEFVIIAQAPPPPPPPVVPPPAQPGSMFVPKEVVVAPPPSTGFVGCAELQRQNPGSVIFCEDFENPAYPQSPGDPITPAWASRWGSETSKGRCMGPVDQCPGEAAGKYAIWTLTKLGQCGGATGESGSSCVFSGNRSYASIHKPLSGSGGETGRVSWPSMRNFGITYAFRMSPTFVPPDDSSSTCGGETTRAGYKMDRLLDGTTKHTLLGHATFSAGAVTLSPGAVGGVSRNFPFRGGFVTPSCGKPPSQACESGPTVRKGITTQNDTATTFGPSSSDYVWGQTEGPGEWICFQLQITNWGATNADHKVWVNERLLYDATENQSRVGDPSGANGLTLENYINGCYNGPNVAARFEDNIVVTNGVPVSCATIGFK